jgi:hypothetical protein
MSVDWEIKSGGNGDGCQNLKCQLGKNAGLRSVSFKATPIVAYNMNKRK